MGNPALGHPAVFAEMSGYGAGIWQLRVRVGRETARIPDSLACSGSRKPGSLLGIAFRLLRNASFGRVETRGFARSIEAGNLFEKHVSPHLPVTIPFTCTWLFWPRSTLFFLTPCEGESGRVLAGARPFSRHIFASDVAFRPVTSGAVRAASRGPVREGPMNLQACGAGRRSCSRPEAIWGERG